MPRPKEYADVSTALPGITGRCLQDYWWNTYSLKGLKSIPWYKEGDDKTTKTRVFRRHPLNTKDEQDTMSRYIEKIKTKGYKRGTRSEVLVVNSDKNAPEPRGFDGRWRRGDGRDEPHGSCAGDACR